MSQQLIGAFALLHGQMMDNVNYRKGYSWAQRHRWMFEKMSLAELVEFRHIFIVMHDNYAAGIAYAILEVISERTIRAGEAA